MDYQINVRLDFDLVRLLLADVRFVGNLHDILENTEYARKLSEKALFLIVEDKGIKAFTAYYLNVKCRDVYITLIAVCEEFRGCGIAQKMIEYLQDSFSGNYASVSLEVYKDNLNAIVFYLSYGFEIVEVKEYSYMMKKIII